MTEVVIPQKRRFLTAAVVAKNLITKANQDTIGDLNFEDFEVTVDRDGKTFTMTLTEAADETKYTETTSKQFSFQRATVEELCTALGFKAQMGAVSTKEQVIAALPEGLETSWDEGQKQLTVRVTAEATKFTFGQDDAVKVTTFLSTTESFVMTFTENVPEESEEKKDLNALITVTELNFTVEELLAPAAAAA